jgi:hypothetical protein
MTKKPPHFETVPSMDAGRAREIVDSMLSADLMDEAAAYRQRGRRYQLETDDELQVQWEKAFCTMVRERTPESFRVLGDINAELSLRDIAPKTDAVREELQRVVDEIKDEQLKYPDGTPWIQEAITRFLSGPNDSEMN